MSFVGTVTAPQSFLAFTKLLAAFQVELSSTHSSTVFRYLEPKPASASSFSCPPLMIVAAWKDLLGVAISPPAVICLLTRSSTSVLLSTTPL